MNHSPVVIEDDLDAQIKAVQKQLKLLKSQKQNLECVKPKEVDLEHAWRYFRINPTESISRPHFDIFYQGSLHALGNISKQEFKRRLIEHFKGQEGGACVDNHYGKIMGLKLLDGYIYEPNLDRYKRWKYKRGILVHQFDVELACHDRNIEIHYVKSQPMTK
jgi:hypothetical protein